MPVRPRTSALSPVLPVLLAAALVAGLAVAVLTTAAGSADAAHRHRTPWECIAHYESTHRWGVSTGNGHYGGLQFSLSTWRYYGGPNLSRNAMPNKATRREQIAVAKRVAFRGWKGHRPQGGGSAWPNTWHRCF